jgi:putative hydrolase of the HAD superfamily
MTHSDFVCGGVIFDLGGVVLHSPFAAIADLETELGVQPNTINFIIAKAGSKGAFARLERGELTVDEFAEPFARDCEQAGTVRIDGDTLMQRICSACTPRPLFVEALQVLREEPMIKTAALTNNFVIGEGSAVVDQSTGVDFVSEVRPLFDIVVESAVEGLRKPDPAIYRTACSRLGVDPAACVFLDDIGRNLKPAQAMGMRTIKCALDDVSGARALGSLAQLLGGSVGRRLQGLLRKARL